MGSGSGNLSRLPHTLAWYWASLWNHAYRTLWPVIGSLLGPQVPQKGPFGPNMPLLAILEGLRGPRGPDFVPSAADWSDWVRTMVTTHFGLVLGVFLAPRCPKRARFGPKCSFWGTWGPRRDPIPGQSVLQPVRSIGGSWDQIWPPGAL